MKEIVYYQCEVCGVNYENQESALECERAHSVLTTIVKKDYLSKRKYPFRVILKFGDEEEKEYYEEAYFKGLGVL
jgi:hypothetical protein